MSNTPDLGDDLTGAGAQAMYAALYDELKRHARRERRRLHAGQTLATTALVNEAYLKLCNASGFADRKHFQMTAAAAMRQVLVDAARAALAEKRGSGAKPLSLDDTHVGQVAADPGEDAETMVALSEALDELRGLSERMAQIVELRYFGGYTDAQVADLLDVNERTVRRDWVKARAWLYDALQADVT